MQKVRQRAIDISGHELLITQIRERLYKLLGFFSRTCSNSDTKQVKVKSDIKTQQKHNAHSKWLLIVLFVNKPSNQC